MTREQALRLWVGTLSRKQAPASATAELLSLWAQAGLDDGDRRALAQALREPDDSERRRHLIRQTRRLIIRSGHDVDLLSTPAANMRGL